MKKFKKLTEELVSLNEYKRGFKSQAAARDVVRSRTPVYPPKPGQMTVVTKNHLGRDEVSAERPDMPGSGKPDNQLLQYNREVGRVSGQESRRAALKAKEEGKAKGARTAANIRQKTAQIVKTEKTAKSFGIPDIDAILAGKSGEKDVAGVTVIGHEKNGYIAKHQGSKHFKHPNGKTYSDVELRASPKGIAVWASKSGTKKSISPIAHIEPKGDAVPVRGGVSKGNITIHAEDELNR